MMTSTLKNARGALQQMGIPCRYGLHRLRSPWRCQCDLRVAGRCKREHRRFCIERAEAMTIATLLEALQREGRSRALVPQPLQAGTILGFDAYSSYSEVLGKARIRLYSPCLGKDGVGKWRLRQILLFCRKN